MIVVVVVANVLQLLMKQTMPIQKKNAILMLALFLETLNPLHFKEKLLNNKNVMQFHRKQPNKLAWVGWIWAHTFLLVHLACVNVLCPVPSLITI